MSEPAPQGGLTLIELMVVVVLVAILAGVAIPSFRNYMERTKRTDATAALLKVAAAQEKFYLQNNRYATNAELAVAPAAGGLGIAGTEHGYYTLSITAADTTRFSAEARPAPGGPQVDDDPCQVFTITDQGVRNSTPSPPNVCWR